MHLFVHTDTPRFVIDLPALATAGTWTLWIDHYVFVGYHNLPHFQMEFFPNFIGRHWQQYHFDQDTGTGVHYASMIPLPTVNTSGPRSWPLGTLSPGTQKVQVHLKDESGADMLFQEADLWFRLE